MAIVLSVGLIISLIALYAWTKKIEVKLWQWIFVLASIFFVSFMQELEYRPYRGNAHGVAYEHLSTSDKTSYEQHPVEIQNVVQKYRKGCFSITYLFDGANVIKLECSNYFERALPSFRDNYIFITK